MDDLGSAYCGKISISLIRKDNCFRNSPFHSRCSGRWSAMGYLLYHHIEIEIVISKNRTANGRHTL